jgi:capsular polysaccharide transport system permease protein
VADEAAAPAPRKPGPKAGAKAGKSGPPPVIQVMPMAEPARFRRRHMGLVWSFVILVLLPIFVTAAYLWGVAQDQYASTVAFTVRREDNTSGALLGGLAQLTGGGGMSEADILYEFIQSQEIVSAIDERVGLGAVYSVHWPSDPVFALWPDARIEELHDYWGRMVRISYDQSTRLIALRVLAFTPEDAQRIAGEIVAESQRMINDLNNQAREDVMRYANSDLDQALARLKDAREALSLFRTRTRIVDPAADLQGRMGVLNNLQQQLAEALIENDLVLGSTQESDPRRNQTARRIQVIRDRIAAERQTFASAEGSGEADENYPELIAEFERLTVDLQFAEEAYRTALAAVDLARANASRQSLYLAPYIRPTLPQTAEFPQRLVLTGLVSIFLGLIWAIGSLVFYSIRDRR